MLKKEFALVHFIMILHPHYILMIKEIGLIVLGVLQVVYGMKIK